MPCKRAARIPSAKQVAAAEKKKTERFEKRDKQRDETYTAQFKTRTLEAWDAFAEALPELAGDNAQFLPALAPAIAEKRAKLEARLAGNKPLDEEAGAKEVAAMGVTEYRAHQDKILARLPVPMKGMRFAIDWAQEDRISNAIRKQVQLLNFECLQSNDLAVLLLRKIGPGGDGLMLGGEAFLCCPNTSAFRASVVMLDVCDNCQTAEFDQYETKFFACGKCRCMRYCSKECQKEHWDEHRATCPLMEGNRRSDVFKRTMCKYLMVLSANAAGTSTTCTPVDGKQLDHPGNAVHAFMAKEQPEMNLLVALTHDGNVQFMPLKRVQLSALLGEEKAEHLAQAMTESTTICLLVFHVLKRSKNVESHASKWQRGSDPDVHAFLVDSRVEHGRQLEAETLAAQAR